MDLECRAAAAVVVCERAVMCAEEAAPGRRCARDAVALAVGRHRDGGDVLVFVCGDCALRWVIARLPDVTLRWLQRPAPGQRRPTIALTCTT